MPYTPKFEEPSESLFIDNVLAIIKRDMKSALDYFYPSDSLPDFVERVLGDFLSTEFPKLSIDPSENGPEQGGDGSWIGEELKVNLIVAVKDADAPTTTRKLMKYMRSLKSVLRTAPTSDYVTGFPPNSIFALRVEVAYRYLPRGQSATDSMRPAQLVLTLKFNER